MNPDWPMVALAVLAFVALRSAHVRCALAPNGHQYIDEWRLMTGGLPGTVPTAYRARPTCVRCGSLLRGDA